MSEHDFDAAIGIFSDAQAARNGIDQLLADGIAINYITEVDRDLETEAPPINFANLKEVEPSHMLSGAATGAGIGAVAGLIGLAVPGLWLGAVITGALGGGLIGGMAGIDEAVRARDQPDLAEYQRWLKAGKSLLIVMGDEARRHRAENSMKSAGAELTFQHPPILELIHPESHD